MRVGGVNMNHYQYYMDSFGVRLDGQNKGFDFNKDPLLVRVCGVSGSNPDTVRLLCGVFLREGCV